MPACSIAAVPDDTASTAYDCAQTARDEARHVGIVLHDQDAHQLIVFCG
jgi:hypothetical protein